MLDSKPKKKKKEECDAILMRRYLGRARFAEPSPQNPSSGELAGTRRRCFLHIIRLRLLAQDEVSDARRSNRRPWNQSCTKNIQSQSNSHNI